MQTGSELIFDANLIKRYAGNGPRYTSYPTAASFHKGIGELDYRDWASRSNELPIPQPLSLYLHIPFCNTICFYCGCNKIVSKKHARSVPYVERLLKEIALQGELFDQDRRVEQLHWGGGTPTFLNIEQMQAIQQATRAKFQLLDDDQGEYSIEIDPRSVDDEKIDALRDMGFNRMSVGVQDFDPRVQKAVNRVQSLQKTAAVLNRAREVGFKSTNIDLIYGLPHQSLDSFSNTLEQVEALNPDRLAVYNYAHLPHRFPPQRRISEADLPSYGEKLEILGLTIDRLSAAGYVFIGMDHFAKPDDELAIAQMENSLHRNFQGYSSRATCETVAMGVSAIGNVHGNFSQNSLDMQYYCDSIDANHLPIIKGYESTPEDEMVRQVIQELMCHFRLDIAPIEKAWGFSFWDYFAAAHDQITRMQADELLTCTEKEIVVLGRGRLLIRNIAMAFDRHLAGQQNSRFSKMI